MKQLEDLRSNLHQCFGWHKARLDCLIHLLLALFRVRTVNLSELAVAFQGHATCASRYKRLYRFLSQVAIDQSRLARWLLRLTFKDQDQVYLVMDRTVWYWGQRPVNILMIGFAWEGIAIPLCWRLLDHAGCSTAEHQIELMQRALHVIRPDQLAGLLLDREFTSYPWLKWLDQQDIPFYVRLKNNRQLKVCRQARSWRADAFFKQLNPKQQYVYPNYVQLNELAYLRVAGSRSERGELMIILTNQAPQQAVPIYLRRWEIESLFQCLKQRGFQFESTRITQGERIERLIAVLAIAVTWAHRVGEWRDQKRPIAWKWFNNQTRPQHSFFSYGLELIRETLLNSKHKGHQFKKCLKMLLVEPPPPPIKQPQEGPS